MGDCRMDLKNKTKDQLILELKKSRRERDRFRSQLDRIIDITAGIIYILDPEGHFVFVNNAVEDILHYESEELIGRHFSVIMTPNEYERVSRLSVLPKFNGKKTGSEEAPKLFDERRTGQRRTKNLEVQLLTKSQKEIRIMAGDVTGIIAVEGAYDRGLMEEKKSKAAAFVGSQGLIFDITRYKKAEKNRLMIQHRLLEFQKMDALGRLAEGIAHDFNNKLGTILGCAEMLKQNYAGSPAEFNMCIDPVISASKHAADLTEKLSLFACNRPPLEEDIGLHTIVRDIMQLLEHTVDKRISIQSSLWPQSPMVWGDSNRLQSALLNVVMNACDAMPEGGSLVFETAVLTNDDAFKKKYSRAKDPARYARISVIDSGVGMDRETKLRMFEPFFTTKTDGSSMGMGLTSVLNFVKTHQGFIEVESGPGKGTRVDVFLPFIGFEQAVLSGAVPEGRSVRGTGRILIVDDEHSFLGISKYILEDLGYSVVTCLNGREAVEYYRKHYVGIDLVIIDIMMPELSGRDCFHEMKKINPSIKAVVSTGFGLNQEVEAVLKDGARDFIHKPFENAKLSQVVSKILAPR
jgi:PAS domain S-box-containing protein